jgi:hypothetical protein
LKNDFNTRKKAAVELRALGELALPALAPHRYDGLERLYRKIAEGLPTAAQVEGVRAVEVLEVIGTPEANRLLRDLAEGAPEALVTRQAQAARLRQEAAERTQPLTGADVRLDLLPGELGSSDARRGYRIMRTLAARPKDAVPLLRERLHALAAGDAFDAALSAERLQAERGLEVLEWVATDEARAALQTLNKEARSRWMKDAATQALHRLGK